MASGHTVRIAEENAKLYAKLTRQWASLNIDRDVKSPQGGHPLIRRWFQLGELVKVVQKDIDRLEVSARCLEGTQLANLLKVIASHRNRLMTLEKQRTDLLVSIQDRVDSINKVLLDKTFQYRELMRKGAFKTASEEEDPSDEELTIAAMELLKDQGFVVINDPDQED